MRYINVRVGRVLTLCAGVNVFCIFAVLLYMGSPTDTPQHADRKYIAPGPAESTECPSVPRPDILLSPEGQWQTVDDRQAFVFSAYYDDRASIGAPRVRVIALTLAYSSDTVFFCHLWYNSKPSFVVVDATKYLFGEGHEKKYDSTFYDCLLPDFGRHPAPYAVSIVTSRCDRASNLLDVQPVRAYVEPAFAFTVCVTPLNFRYDRHHQVMEMIEVNRLFGATNFVFYNYSSGDRVTQYLLAMQREHLVDVIQWPLPVIVDTWPPIADQTPEVHYFAQVAALNDCLYRHMSASRYIVFTDLDEFIVPRGVHATWMNMLSALPPGGSAYMFRNVFFWRDWPDDATYADTKAVRQNELVTLLKTTRQKELYPYYERSKCIVAPSSVVAMGVHNVVAFADDLADHVEVEPSLGMVHHYRSVLTPSDIDVRSTRDRYMHRFANKIIRKVAGSYSKKKNRTKHGVDDEAL